MALFGHKNGSITSHYSAAELDQLIEAANKVSVTAHLHQFPESVVIERWRTEHGRGTRRRRRDRQVF